MRLKVGLCLAIAVMLVWAAGRAVPAYAGGGPAGRDPGFELVFQVPAGSGAGVVGVLPNAEGNVPEGPQALAVDEAGSIYVADSVGRQVLIFDGTTVRTINVPFVHYARDLAVAGGKLFVLDVSDRIFIVGADGTLERTVLLPVGMTHLNVLKLVPALDVPGEVLLWCSNYIQFSLGALPGQVDPALWGKAGLAVAGVGPTTAFSGGHGPRDKTARSLLLADQNLLDLLDGRGDTCGRITSVGGGIGSARIVGFDSRGWVYLLVEELGAPNPGVQVEVSLRAYNEAGTLVRAMRFPLEDMAAVPWQPAAVTPTGDVYVLIPGSAVVSVYRAQPGNSYVSHLTRETTPESGTGSPGGDAGIQTVYYGKFKGYPIPQTRSGVRSRAMQMVDYNWTWHNTYNYLSDGRSRATVGATAPDHFSGLTEGATVHGIPYCWGGWDSLWTYSDNRQWTSFGNALGKYYPGNGPLVGNINSSAWISGTAGIDCSGFAAAASDTYYIGTVGGDECYKPGCGNLQSDGIVVSNVVSPPTSPTSPNYAYYSGMQPMSFYVNSGHVLYYNYRLLDGSGMATVESTTGGYEDGAKTYSRIWSDLRNYSCRTWWEKDTGNDFDQPWTTKAGKTIIQGAQVYYKFQATGTSTTITVTASSGDPDFYFYNSSYGYITRSTNVGSDSVTISTTVGAWYYVKVHAWTDCTYTINW